MNLEELKKARKNHTLNGINDLIEIVMMPLSSILTDWALKDNKN